VVVDAPTSASGASIATPALAASRAPPVSIGTCRDGGAGATVGGVAAGITRAAEVERGVRTS
jgi:hypothetical protein